jgi:hypothetical protein
MNRLIDANLLKKNCKCTGNFEDNFMCVDLITLADVIDNQPTVYDVDLEQLKLYKVAFDILLKDDCKASPGNWCGSLDELYEGRKDYYMDLAKKELSREGEDRWKD